MRTPGRYARHRKNGRSLVVAFGLALVLVSGGIFFVSNYLPMGAAEFASVQSEPPAQETALQPDDPGEKKNETPTTGGQDRQDRQEKEPMERLDTRKLYGEVADIAKTHDGVYGVAIYDPESNKGILYNGDEEYDAASIGKLPVLAALYREAASGKLELDEDITIQYTDVQSYGSGVLHYRPVGTELSLKECAYHLIKDSDNTAWTMLYRRLGIERVSDELTALGAKDSRYDSHGRLYTDASDTLEILKEIQNPDYTNRKLSNEMLSLMTDTAFEGRIPEPLPKDKNIKVAHKIGSNGRTFGDAGIVFYENSKDPNPEGEGSPDETTNHYYIVVLAKETTGLEATAAMREISLAAYRAIV